MLGQQNDMNQQARSGTIGSFGLFVDLFIKYIVMPVALFWVSTQISLVLRWQESINDELRQLQSMQTEQSKTQAIYRANFDDHKLLIDKELKLIDYRLKILEQFNERLYTEFFYHGGGAGEAISRMGAPANIKRDYSGRGIRTAEDNPS